MYIVHVHLRIVPQNILIYLGSYNLSKIEFQHKLAKPHLTFVHIQNLFFFCTTYLFVTSTRYNQKLHRWINFQHNSCSLYYLHSYQKLSNWRQSSAFFQVRDFFLIFFPGRLGSSWLKWIFQTKKIYYIFSATVHFSGWKIIQYSNPHHLHYQNHYYYPVNLRDGILQLFNFYQDGIPHFQSHLSQLAVLEPSQIWSKVKQQDKWR